MLSKDSFSKKTIMIANYNKKVSLVYYFLTLLHIHVDVCIHTDICDALPTDFKSSCNVQRRNFIDCSVVRKCMNKNGSESYLQCLLFIFIHFA